MAQYKLTAGSAVLRGDGAFIPSDAANRDWQSYQAWRQAGNTPDPAAPPPVQTTISAYAYFNRFTSAETAAIHTAALASPPTPTSLALFNYLMLATADGQVGLVDPIVVTGHGLLVSLGLLTSARSTAILQP